MLAVTHLRASVSFLPSLHTVTSLQIHNIWAGSLIEFQHWKDILSSLKHLISLVVNGDVVTSPTWISGGSVTLPVLRTLEINVVDLEEPESDLFECLYDTIDAPLLECLLLHNYIDGDLAFLEDSWHLGASKFPMLGTLVLSGLGEEVDSLNHFMQAFPHTQAVIFKAPMKGHLYEVLQLLQETDGPHPRYWPRLRHLTAIDLQFSDRDDMNELLLTCFVGRMSMGKPIETLALTRTDIDKLSVYDDGLFYQAEWMDLVKVVEYESDDEA
ncbi:hypothetical protein HWV62_41828 [Athelia sp. TMB]|nr:hypothetical protein HWV62_41828 [Athelia sp. TMB]